MARRCTVALIVVIICLQNVFRHRQFFSAEATAGYKGRYGAGAPVRYEIVIPQKVDENGDFVSHVIPHHFKGTREKTWTSAKVNYLVPIAGEDHHLELVPNEEMISPAMVVESHDGEGVARRNIKRATNVHCHYRGSVKGVEDSRAAISTCHGLSGYIRTKRGYYVIEPAATELRAGRGEHGHPHLVYRHDDDPKFVHKRPYCGTGGDVAEAMATRAIRELAKTSGGANETNGQPTGPEMCYNRTENQNITELHIEAMVVLDHAMLKYHKEFDVENYVLTVFNMAHDLYHDASLGTNINLAIVRLVRLENEDHELNLSVNKDAAKTLEYFRIWQNKMNPGDDTHPNHHDVAVLLTRIDICGKDDSCALLGVSRLGGMCDPLNTAAVCEDNGLRLGFVIAHEIGHTLAMTHDVSNECGCDGTVFGGLTSVMNPAIAMTTVEWSECSAKYLKLFIDSGFGKCLYDPPTDHSFTLVDVLPGVMYGGDFQCKELLGPEASLCDTGLNCENLICYVEDEGCVETHMPAAPGTSCGEKQWCYRNKCLEMGERPGAIDGGWGDWSPWSSCTRTCGSGVAYQERHCDNPRPKHGGKYCIGEHRRHKICSTEPCDIGAPSFRDIQCADFNDWVYPEDDKIHIWKSYRMPEENPCVLFCVNDKGSVASLRPRVIDGTTCYHGMRDICINGLCREIPCDLDLESNAVEDVCGVCHGDGTTCKLVEGQEFFMYCEKTEEANSGVQKTLDIPKDAVNIKVEEAIPSDSAIQVRNKDGTAIYIKGDELGLFSTAGSRAWLGMIRTKQEALNIPGPITEEVTIWMIVKENVTVKYSYGVKETQKRTPSFYWDYVEWGRCSAECGPGIQEAIAKCLEKQAGLVEDTYCKDLRKPKEQVRSCEVAPCTPRWMIGDWQPCEDCPNGKKTRIVKCVKPTGEGEGESVIISDSECVKPKPVDTEHCTCVKIKKDAGGIDADSDSEGLTSRRKRVPGSTPVPISKRAMALNCHYNISTSNGTSNIQTEMDQESDESLDLRLHMEGDECVGGMDVEKNDTSIEMQGHKALEYMEKKHDEFSKEKAHI